MSTVWIDLLSLSFDLSFSPDSYDLSAVLSLEHSGAISKTFLELSFEYIAVDHKLYSSTVKLVIFPFPFVTRTTHVMKHSSTAHLIVLELPLVPLQIKQFNLSPTPCLSYMLPFLKTFLPCPSILDFCHAPS